MCYVFMHSGTFLCRSLQTTNGHIQGFVRTYAQDGEFFMLSLNVNIVPTTLLPGQFAPSVQIKRTGIIAR